MSVDARLREWGESHHDQPWNYWPSENLLARMMAEGAGSSHRTDRQSDGGMFSSLGRGYAEMARDIRTAEINEATRTMPWHMKWVMNCTYRCPSARDVPRRGRAAVTLSGLSNDTYYRHRKELFHWLANYLSAKE